MKTIGWTLLIIVILENIILSAFLFSSYDLADKILIIFCLVLADFLALRIYLKERKYQKDLKTSVNKYDNGDNTRVD